MKKILSGLLTLAVIIALNWLAAFIEFSFLTGLAAVIVIGWFTSSGGFSSDHVRMQTQGDAGLEWRQSPAAASGFRCPSLLR